LILQNVTYFIRAFLVKTDGYFYQNRFKDCKTLPSAKRLLAGFMYKNLKMAKSLFYAFPTLRFNP